jgi:hypothetical protein
MRLPASFLHLLCVLAACLSPQLASAEKQTVCTITVNSPDEQESFRRFLPASKYQFVELVERHRPDAPARCPLEEVPRQARCESAPLGGRVRGDQTDPAEAAVTFESGK